MFTLRRLLASTALFLAIALTSRADIQLNLSALGVARQSSDPSPATTAAQAIDGNVGTFSQTADAANSFWEVELSQKVRVDSISVVAKSLAANGLTVRVYDLRDQTLFKATISGVSPGGTWTTNLPSPVNGRIVHFAIENSPTNGAGNAQVEFSEVQVFGDASPALGPVTLGGATVSQSSTSSTFDATKAVDDNTSTYSMTADLPDSYWLMTFDQSRPIQRIELVNSSLTSHARMQGLILRILDDASNSVASTTVSDPGAENNFIYTPPPGASGRYVKIGLEGGTANGAGDHVVSFAEVSVLTATNVVAGKVSYMTRDSDTMPPDSFGNDDNYSTVIGTTGLSTHDFYWEANLGQSYALYSVRIAAADGMQVNMTHATLSIYDDNYDLVYSQHLGGNSDVFDVALPGPVFGHYVHLGLDYAERTTGLAGSATWLIGMKEVQAFGRGTNEVGLTGFTATPGDAVVFLNWQETDLYSLNLYPNVGSVGSNTATSGAGARAVAFPTNTVEYVLVGSNYNGSVPSFLTVEVNGKKAPVQISEFLADNSQSIKDGNNNNSDWIELHNPNNTSVDLTGYALTDDSTKLTKWMFPAGVTITPHGYLIVFADSANTSIDPGGDLHANFGLDKDGDSIVLTVSNGVAVVDGITNFPAQMTDLAYGRTLDGVWKFLEPTPGAANIAGSYDGWLAPLVFDHQRGWYTNNFSLTISNPNAGATVYWSVDGTDPTNVYTGPLAITNVAGVRAAVARAGYKSARTQTQTYLFLAGIINSTNISATYRTATYTNRLVQGFSDLPIFSVNVPAPDSKWDFLGYNNERPERPASFEIFMPDGSNIQQDCGMVHYGGQFGTGTGLYAKKTWQLDFRSQYGNNKLNFPLFQGFGHGITPMNSFKELDVHSGNQDQGGYGGGRGFYMSHRFSGDTMLDMGDLNPHGRFVQLFINGAYMGQFDVHERLTDKFLGDYLGGQTEDYQTVKGNDNTGTFGFIPGVPDPPDRWAWENVRSNRFSYAAIKDAVDMTNCVDFMLMWEWGNAESEYRGAGGRVAVAGGGHGFKVWLADADGHLRQQSGASGLLGKNNVTTSVFTNGPGYIFGALLAEGNPDFKSLLADRIYKHCFNGGAMTPAANLARLNLRMAEITNSMVAECARWGASSTYDPSKWQTDAQYARDNIFPARTTTLFNQFRAANWYPSIDPPQLSQFGGSITNGYTLTVNSAAGTIYYTLDGSDPRLPGGGISPSAIAWTPGTQITTLVNLPANSTWRYYNTNAAPIGSWTGTSFNDSTWLTGNTPMGYGNDDKTNIISTFLSYGSDSANKFASYYFRKTFSVTNFTGITNMVLGLNRDDGAVVYLNGIELKRDNMPAGAVVYSTLGTTNVSGPNETNLLQFTVATNLLLIGTNTVAVEVHQASVTSSDVMFNLSLNGSITNAAPLQLTLTNQTTFTARVWNGTTWSALAQTTFNVAPLRQPAVGDLIISEMNYHPVDLDNFEFVEVYNAGTNLLDLTNVRLSDGIDFTFPNHFQMAPRTFAVAARSIPDFNVRYQTPTSPYYYSNIVVAGQYTGKLSDSGERIALLASNSTVLAEVTYSDGGAWPDRADGNGSSLELRDLSAAVAAGTNINAYLARGDNWKSSSLYNGSPGREDTAPQNIVINEVLAHTALPADWLEFRNLNSDPVDLGGLYISDHYDNPFRYLVPTNTIVPANGYLGLSCADFGFGFSDLGSDILLLEASGTNIIRFIDTVNISASAPEESLGLYALSDGDTDFTELRANTEGLPNALPRVGPVVISEVMYKPAANQSEFVELVNISKTNVLLYDPAFPTNTWQIAGGVTFNLPTGQQLLPGGIAILCGTNPATFRAQYGVSASIPVFGPWIGALNNAGDSVKLQSPGVPEIDGTVPYYRVDHLRYEPGSPWPAAASGTNGISLERVTLEGYANDPVNWQASIAGGTRGTFVGNRPPSVSVDGFTTVTEGDTVSLTIQGSDLDQPWQSVSLSAQNLPSASSFNASTGAFTWTTGETDGPNVYNLQFIATDNGLEPLVRTQIVAVTVLESNLPPSIQTFTNLTYPAGIPFSMNVSASDPDLPPQPLRFSASGLPTGLGVDPVSGRISGAAQAEGVFSVTVSVSDDQSPALIATNGFTLTITHAFISQAMLNANPPQFSFWSLSGESYDVLFSPQLPSTNWQVLQSVSNAPGGLVTISNPPAGTNGFMRILWKR